MAVVLFFLLNAAHVLNIRFIQQMEAFSYDLRLNLTMPSTQDRRVVIVDIDEKSLAQEGRWPWSRNKLARLVDQLFDRYHVAIAGFDVVFAEKDESSGLNVLESLEQTQLKGDAQYRATLQQLRGQLDFDRVFAQHIKGRKVVLGYYFSDNEGNRVRTSGLLPPPVFPAGTFKGMNIPFVTMNGYGANLPQLQQSALSAGHFNPYPDADGVTRRVPMLIEYRGAEYESLPLAVLRSLQGNPPMVAGLPDDGESGGDDYGRIEWLGVGNLQIPVDERVNALVPYRGRQGSFAYVSATDVLQGRLPVDSLRGKIILVGTTAPGLMDLRSTPVSAVYPGVEVHANMIAGALDHNIKQKPAYVLAADVLTLLVLGLLLGVWLPFLSPLRATVITFAILSIVVGLNLMAWQEANLVLPLAGVLMELSAIYLINMSYGYFIESRAKKQITGLFGQYVPPDLVDEMSKNPGDFSMEGDSRAMTVLFSDVRNFTTISEGMEPKELSRLMNEYMTPMTYSIQKWRGTIDKYIGDAIMAFWGAPLHDPDHARNAVLSALDMQKTLDVLRPQFIARGWPEIRIGIGVNTGVMSVGNMGSQFRMAYTVMGDAVNLGARLEGITKQYGVGILVGEETVKAVPEVVYREIDRVRVKGKDEPVAIFEPLGLVEDVSKELLDAVEHFHQALQQFRSQNWVVAEAQLKDLQEQSALYVYQVYLDRIAFYRANPPPPDWDGVYVFTTK